MKWAKRVFWNVRDFVERSFGRSGGAHQEAGALRKASGLRTAARPCAHAGERPEVFTPGSDARRCGAAYESERPASYNTTRAIFLQLLGCTYLIAFASHFVQFEGLYGCDGILPVQQQMEMAQGLHWTLYPTLVRFHSTLGLDVYWLCNFLSVVGLVLSALAAAGYGCAPIMAGCWVSYLSLTTVGDIFMLFQWDSLLLETGFLAILYAPLLQRPSRTPQTSRVAMWMLRFLLFKLILMSGVVKITSKDRVWQELTALYYHFASQVTRPELIVCVVLTCC